MINYPTLDYRKIIPNDIRADDPDDVGPLTLHIDMLYRHITNPPDCHILREPIDITTDNKLIDGQIRLDILAEMDKRGILNDEERMVPVRIHDLEAEGKIMKEWLDRNERKNYDR